MPAMEEEDEQLDNQLSAGKLPNLNDNNNKPFTFNEKELKLKEKWLENIENLLLLITMGRVCAVPGCKVVGPSVSLHAFPTNPQLRNKWITTLGINSTTKTTGVCSKHFTSQDFVDSHERKTLRRNVVPTLSPDSSDAQSHEQIPQIIVPENSKHTVLHTLNFDHWGGGIQHVVLVDEPQDIKETMSEEKPNQRSKTEQRFCYSKEFMSHQLEKKRLHIQQVNRRLRTERTKNARLKAKVQVLQEVINKLKDNIDPNGIIVTVSEEGHMEAVTT